MQKTVQSHLTTPYDPLRTSKLAQRTSNVLQHAYLYTGEGALRRFPSVCRSHVPHDPPVYNGTYTLARTQCGGKAPVTKASA